jgi:outer membrane protein TolC
LELQRIEELAALDTRSAWAELLAAQATWDASAGTLQQAGRAYQIAEVRYQAGVSTQLELSDARLQLQQADLTRAQAARDLQVARARVALLPELPLGQGTGGARPPVQPPQPAAPVTPAPALPLGGGQLRNASTGQSQPLADVAAGARRQ